MRIITDAQLTEMTNTVADLLFGSGDESFVAAYKQIRDVIAKNQFTKMGYKLAELNPGGQTPEQIYADSVAIGYVLREVLNQVV